EGDVLPFNEVEGRDRDMLSEKRDYTDSDGASDAERGRNEYVMNNKYDDTFEEIYHGDDIDKYLNGETPASDVDGSGHWRTADYQDERGGRYAPRLRRQISRS